MNKAILHLEKRKTKVLKMRNNYLFTCNKETDFFEQTIIRFDRVINQLVEAIKAEWIKTYRK